MNEPTTPPLVSIEGFANRLYNLRGIMLIEKLRGRPAVTFTFVEPVEAIEFNNTLCELLEHRSSLEGSTFLRKLVENAFSWGKQDCNYLNPTHIEKFIEATRKGMLPKEAATWVANGPSPQQHVLTEDGWAYVAPAIDGGTTSREWQRKFPSLWHAVSAASQDLLVAADLVRNKQVKARLMLHWDTVNGIAHALDRYARQPQSPVNRLDANAPILREQGRLAEQHQPDQGMTSTSGDAQTSYPPGDCSNGTAREQLAREGSCNASSLERSGSIDAEVDNTTVPGTPSPQTHVSGIENEIARVVQSVNEWDDRTSPDEYPEHLLITSEELADILRNFAASITTEGKDNV